MRTKLTRIIKIIRDEMCLVHEIKTANGLLTKAEVFMPMQCVTNRLKAVFRAFERFMPEAKPYLPFLSVIIAYLQFLWKSEAPRLTGLFRLLTYYSRVNLLPSQPQSESNEPANSKHMLGTLC